MLAGEAHMQILIPCILFQLTKPTHNLIAKETKFHL